MRIGHFLRDPLAHFLAIGGGLFILLSIMRPAEDPDHIVVDRPALLSFIQYRSRAFEEGAAALLLDQMTDDERAALIDAYVREEALFREAAKLDLDAGDYVIRQRMVQKLEFLSEAAATSAVVDDRDLRKYFDANGANYKIPRNATLSHVYLSGADRSEEDLTVEAATMIAQLEADSAKFSDATRYGDRFLFHTNYVERTYDYIRSHFGPLMTDEIFSDETPLSDWSGPFYSDHGAHLVFITARSPEDMPDFEAVKSRVEIDFLEQQQAARNAALIDEVVAGYRVDIRADDIRSAAQRSGQ